MNENIKEYKKYIDFLTDEDFIKWQLYPTQELDDYWKNFIEKNPDTEETLQTAIDKFRCVRINDCKLSTERSDELYNRIQGSVSKMRRKRKLWYCRSAAACAILIIASAFCIKYINKDNKQNDENQSTIVGITLPSKDIQLISGSNVVEIKQDAELQLSPDGQISITEGEEGGSGKTSGLDISKENINKLIVPYGKRSVLVLADGSKVWLNSGTEIEFPSHFNGKERKISVIGEIYIDVTERKEQPFIVHTSRFDVRVYGTKFNVSSYQDSFTNSVVLVEGKVEVQTGGTSRLLNPGELLAVEEGNLRHEKVDTDEYTSWKDGFFILKQTPVSEILKKVGRYYNVGFNENQSALMKRACTGKLFLSEDIEQVLDILCTISNTTYTRDGSKIYINDKTK
ncbi:FecR domain-containing protein [Dysgonomonas sp. GY75]|uniref:FecR family protein n=1 Tax=Dysgonomonas sp. GY75 TaxID=2780419 RepID=UPI0018845234|nr:FecR family protein [Dysgonomonas sp. GY75]MBF0647923.1 FecR domain-containing protein [Dysgonomonas sp. GY75]